MSPWMEAGLRAGLHGCLLAAFVLIVVLAAKRLSPGVRCALWWLVLAEFSIGCLFAIPVRWGEIDPVGNIRQQVEAAGRTATPAVSVAGDAQDQTRQDWLPTSLFVVWLAGAAWVIGYGVVGTVRMASIRRNAVPADPAIQGEVRRLAAELGLSSPPTVWTSNAVSSPAVFGLFRPCVLVPASFTRLTPEEREMALAHELGHVMRRDAFFALVADCATALFWFLPIVHWVKRAWAVERELACDAIACARPGVDRTKYRNLLLKIVEKDAKPMPVTALGATADFRCLKRRLLAAGGPARGSGRFAGVLALPLVGVLALPVAVQPAPTDGGLLSNAGFEEGGATPRGWGMGGRIDGVRYVWDESVAHSGRRSIGFRKTADRYFPIGQWSQAVDYDGKSPAVEFEAWVKVKGMYKAVLDVQFATDEGASSHQWVAFVGAETYGDPPVTHEWKKLGGVAKIPPGTKQITFALQDYGPGEAWMDDASARYVPAAK